MKTLVTHLDRPTNETANARRRQQIQQPWFVRWTIFVVTGLLSILVRLWFGSLRFTVEGAEYDEQQKSIGKGIYVSWHRAVLLAMYFWRHRRGYILTSASKDGEWAAGLIRWFGNRSVRGSSSKGGQVALELMVEKIKAGHLVGLVTDAPRGPPRQSKPGVIAMAQRSGVPILPTQYAAQRCVRLKNWDQTILPLPFSRVFVKYGPPFFVAPDLKGEAFETRRREFDAEMNRLTDQVDQYFARA